MISKRTIEQAKKHYRAVAQNQARYQSATKAILSSSGISSFAQGYYFAFNDQIFSLTSKFGNGNTGKLTVLNTAYVFCAYYVKMLGSSFNLAVCNKILALYSIPAYSPSTPIEYEKTITLSSLFEYGFDFETSASIVSSYSQKLSPQILNPNGNDSVECYPTSGLTNWQCVSSLHQTEPDENTTWVNNLLSGVSTLIDLYTLEPNTLTLDDIITSVTATFRCKKIQFYLTAVCQATPKIKTHGVVYNGTIRALTTSWVSYTNTWTTNPYTGLAWTKDEIDALIAGIALTNNNGDRANAYCTWLKLAVNI